MKTDSQFPETIAIKIGCKNKPIKTKHYEN